MCPALGVVAVVVFGGVKVGFDREAEKEFAAFVP
jgi:ABC-type lipoprotein release transport system permease subunit